MAGGGDRRPFDGTTEQIEVERRRLELDEVLELLPEVLKRQARRRRELRELFGILEVVSTQPDHVAPGDRVARRVDVDEAHARPTRLTVDHLAERNRHEMAAL